MRREVFTGTESSVSSCCVSQSAYTVRTSTTWYEFYIEANTIDFYYIKSTNRGISWSVPISIHAGTVQICSVWFDKRTPGDTGTLVNLSYIDFANHTVYYRSFDTNGDSLGTERTVFTGVSSVAGANTCLTITKMRGGKLRIIFDLDGGTETGHYDSTDGITWNLRADPNEATSDYYLAFPDNATDNQDAIIAFWDRSAEEISVKSFDDSGDAWAEVSVATSMTDIAATTAGSQWAGVVRDTDNHLLLAAWSNRDTLNADLRLFDINTSASITEKTNIVQNSTDDQSNVALCMDTDNDWIYAFYFGKSDGSETVGTTVGLYYKVSTDGGTTWGSETSVGVILRDYRCLIADPLFNAGEYMLVLGYANIGAARLPIASIAVIPTFPPIMTGGFNV